MKYNEIKNRFRDTYKNRMKENQNSEIIPL